MNSSSRGFSTFILREDSLWPPFYFFSFPHHGGRRTLDLLSQSVNAHQRHFLLAGTINGRYCCPQLYINHRCFSGPYLNKGRIAELPQSVGPGKCVLVLKEVWLSYLLGGLQGETWIVGCLAQNLIRRYLKLCWNPVAPSTGRNYKLENWGMCMHWGF